MPLNSIPKFYPSGSGVGFLAVEHINFKMPGYLFIPGDTPGENVSTVAIGVLGAPCPVK